MILLSWLFATHAQALELGASIIWEQNLHLWRWVEALMLAPCNCLLVGHAVRAHHAWRQSARAFCNVHGPGRIKFEPG